VCAGGGTRQQQHPGRSYWRLFSGCAPAARVQRSRGYWWCTTLSAVRMTQTLSLCCLPACREKRLREWKQEKVREWCLSTPAWQTPSTAHYSQSSQADFADACSLVHWQQQHPCSANSPHAGPVLVRSLCASPLSSCPAPPLPQIKTLPRRPRRSCRRRLPSTTPTTTQSLR
jgi:hypothetical protein